MARINLNGAFLGLYVEVEQVDKTFLKRSNLKGIARLNRADERDLGSDGAYSGEYERETDKTRGFAIDRCFARDLLKHPTGGLF